jgi:hypothetical protein
MLDAVVTGPAGPAAARLRREERQRQMATPGDYGDQQLAADDTAGDGGDGDHGLAHDAADGVVGGAGGRL